VEVASVVVPAKDDTAGLSTVWCPGPTRTEGTDSLGEGLQQLAAQAPAGRPAKAEEIAEAIVFLATDRASFIQGAKLAVDGGRTAV
jgi:NAD(P)-dependent dehydrogenase (short-subunit alcohol dehydrogenase family)